MHINNKLLSFAKLKNIIISCLSYIVILYTLILCSQRRDYLYSRAWWRAYKDGKGQEGHLEARGAHVCFLSRGCRKSMQNA